METLPPELLSKIVDQTPWQDRLTLSSASKQLRFRLAPQVIRASRLTNFVDATAARHLEVFGSHDWAQQAVETLVFVGSHRDVAAKDNDHDPQCSCRRDLTLPSLTLPDVVRRALSGQLFHNASTVRVEFDFGDFNEHVDHLVLWEHESNIVDKAEDIQSIYVHEIPETDLDVIAAKEKRYPWRALMAAVWAAVAENGNIRILAADKLVPKPTSTFFTDKWAELMARVSGLEISLWSGPDLNGVWCSNTTDGYLHFEEHLDGYFFAHCSDALETLKLSADSSTPFGGHGGIHDCLLPLRHPQLPGLRYLELGHMYISRELASFITGHRVLQRLKMVNCHANCSSSFDSWADFFELLTEGLDGENLAQSGTFPLRELDIIFENLINFEDLGMKARVPVPMDVDEMGFNQDEDDQSRRRKAVVAAFRAAGRMAFSYGEPQDKYGYFEKGLDANFEAFTHGDDDEAYRRLLDKLAINEILSS